jgi:hypothetical protein
VQEQNILGISTMQIYEATGHNTASQAGTLQPTSKSIVKLLFFMVFIEGGNALMIEHWFSESARVDHLPR